MIHPPDCVRAFFKGAYYWLRVFRLHDRYSWNVWNNSKFFELKEALV